MRCRSVLVTCSLVLGTEVDVDHFYIVDLENFVKLRPSVLDLWVITFPFGYHWECIRGHGTCAESRDPWVRGQKQLHFWNPRPRFAYSLYNFYWATTTIKGRLLLSVTNAKALHCVNFLTFDRLTLNSCLTWLVTWPTLSPRLKTLRLFIHELRVITVPIDYHWKCVRGHCACAESRDAWVGGQKQLYLESPTPICLRLGCSLFQEPKK